MNSPLTSQPSPLQRARAQLQAIHHEHESIDPKGTDTGTLARMMVHMDNIEKSVSASMEDHVNASKRLLDFGNTVERMAKHLSPSFPQGLEARMGDLVDTLRAAGTALGGSGGPPAWASAIPNRKT